MDIERTINDVTYRFRVNHARTQRSGWQHETTTEITGGGDPGVLLQQMRGLLAEVDQVAREETARRNRIDAGLGDGDA